MTNPICQGEMPGVPRAPGPGQTRGAETSVPALSGAHSPCAGCPARLPALPSAELRSVRQGFLSHHLPKVPNIFLLPCCCCQGFENNMQFIHHSPRCQLMASGMRDDDQPVNLAESSGAAISPGCFLGLINAKEKESCWKM